MLKLLKSDKGVTLIEVIISIAILGIIVAPLSSLFVITAKINRDARDMLTVNQVAQEAMEASIVNDTLTTQTGFATQSQKTSIDVYNLTIGENNEDDFYHGFFEIEKSADNDVDIYKMNTSIQTTRIPVAPSVTINDSHEFQILVAAGKIKIDTIDSTDTDRSWEFLYNKGSSDPVRIRVECYQDNNITFKVTNKLVNDVEFHIVKSSSSSSSVNIQRQFGKVKVITNIFDDSVIVKDKVKLDSIKVKVSEGNTYTESEKVGELDTLIKSQ